MELWFSSLIIFLGAIICVLLSTIQGAYLIAQQYGKAVTTHFIMSLLWVGLISILLSNPLIFSIPYALGSALGVYFSRYIDITLMITIPKKD
jgi:cellulose synthase/poly-beta-1,6-N-acetylglucosamine synthase-like glycosyltransferase